MIWDSIKNWFLSLGENYGVNPLIFGAIYVGAIPLFSLSIAWLIRNYRQGKPIVLPTIAALFFFVSAYIYLIFAGRNVPFWVYGIVILLVITGAYSTVKKIRTQVKDKKDGEKTGEGKMNDGKKNEIYDLIVIGGGSAGLVAAGGAGILGARVALVEKNALGGDCLYTGCVPSKTLIKSARFAHEARAAKEYGFQDLEPKFLNDSFASITNRVQNVIEIVEHHDAPEVFEKMGVEIVFGSPRFLNPNEIEVSLKDSPEKRVMRAKRFCISTGSRPFVPPIEGLKEVGFITNEEVFHLKELPERLVILGGGAIGAEIGQSFARFGSKVTVVEMGERILSKEDEEVSALMEKLFREEGLEVLTKTKAVKVRKSDGGAKIVAVESNGKTFEIETDEILAAAGRTPNIDGLDLEKAAVEFDKKQIKTNDYLQTTQKHIFAAGDVTGHFQFTHMADYEAQIVIQNAFVPFPFKKKTDFRVVPWATFTEPEIGRVGMTEKEAREKFGGEKVKVYKVNFTENDRAQTDGATVGFAKIVTNKGIIVGATLVGEHAGELIHEFVWAMKENLKVSDLNKIIRVYPTLAKIVQAVGTEATLESLKSPFVQKWFARYLWFWR
jgi:pyruvate/2-oxoglutarate dehydrogenase complex dihydrolipoamide dehydrogenase (E3) component